MNTEESQSFGIVGSGDNLGFIPLPGQATDAETQLARLEDFMNAGYDAEAAKRAREYYGEGVPIEHIAEEDKSYFVGAAFARIKGVPNNPEVYWRAQRKDIPDVEREQMFELLGAELRQQVRGKWDERQARIKAVEESLGRMDVYVRGDELGEVFSEQDLANVRGVTDAETMADAEAVRSWMRTYMLPLAGKDDAEEVLRTLDGLEDEFFEVIGTSPRRAELAYDAMMHWAEGMKQSGKVGVTDEFIVGVGKKLSNWGKAAHLMAPAVAMAPVGNPDFPSMLSDEAMAGQQAELVRRQEEYARHENARSILRAAINKSLELGDDVSWWKGAARTASQMAGDSSAYLLPGVGMYTGTADLLVGGATETVDRFALQGLSGDAAAGQAAIETGVQALVELMPWGRVGGKGLSSFTRRYFGDAVEKGTAGKFSRWVVRNTQKSTARALLAEGAASFVDEGILEPIAGGLLTYGAEQAADVLGIAHAQSREFTECFDELKALYTDPYQAAGLLLFTAGLTGAGAYGVHQNVKYFARHRKMWEAAGLTPEQVDRVMAADDRVELGGKLVREGWETDPAGMRERVLKVNKDFAERGEVLVLTGEGALDAELENSELAPAYRAVWQEYQEKGLLPKVEAVGDNQFRITKEGVDITLDARGADAYLQHAIDEVDRMQTRELQQRLGEGHFVDLRAELADAVSTIAGGAAMRAAEAASERTGIAVADITKGLPEWLADGIVKRGQITLKDAQDITEWAIGRIDGLVQEGMSPADARLTRASADGMARTLGDWSTFARDFAHREQLAGLNPGEGAISISRTRNEQAVAFDGRQVLGQTIMTLPGNVRHQGAVEDVTESFADMMVQQRAAVIREAKPESTPAEAEKAAWQELGEQVQRARAAVLKADSAAEIEEVKPGDKMSIIEALSTMATSKFVASGAVPGWMQSLTAALKGNLTAADSLDKVRAAYANVLQSEPAAVSELDTMLNKLGVYVQDTFREARIEAVDIQAWKHARALVTARAESPAGSGGAPVSEVVQQAGENYEVRVTSYEFESSAATPQEVAREAQEILDGMVPGSNAPAEMQGVFVDDKCYYNAAGDYWCGMIDKHKLRDGTEQVKVGTKGKHGVIAGRELTGRFRHDTASIYVWKRTNGELQVISGRHRFAKLMEDDSAQSCNCYVYVEDAAHDERWARMLDYENNMCDDQADEVTAATYVRETGLSDAELEVRGLMRNGTRCKRGALIGRFAREELWTRFINGAVKPMDAEIICNLTRSIREQGRVEEIQRRCCMLLDEKKSWEYIGAMVQLMANKENVVMKQGLLDFGADFEADLARAAEWIERNIKAINESVTSLKQGRKLSGKKRAEAERLGISTATQEGTEQMLYDLEMLRGQFEMIGSYPDLVAAAQMWDGVTEVDPVGQYLERARAEREQVRAEAEMTTDEYLEEQARKAAAEAVPSLFSMSMQRATPEMEQIKAAAVKNGSFMKAPNGKPTRLTEHQWLQVRTGAFKGWFGDWEKVAELTFDGSEYNNETCLKMLVEEAGTPFVNDETGIEAEINNRQRGKITSGKAQRKSRESGFSTGVHNYVAAHIRRLFKHAVHIGDYRDKNASDDILAIKRFVCPVRIKGVEAFAYMTVKELKQHGHKIYTLELDTIERLGGNLDEHFEEMLNPAPSKDIVARLKALSKTFFEDVSKVVDENGEPLVVYHGTEYPKQINIFKVGKNGYLGPGIYFTPEMRTALNYTGIYGGEGVVYKCFVNMHNPFVISFADKPAKVILDIVSMGAYEKRIEQQSNESKLLMKGDISKLRRKGYDGVVWLPKYAYDANSFTAGEMMVFKPNQIKSATDNRGTFDGSNADITFSVTGGKNLAAVHSIPVDAMLDVEKKLGGLPKPSIAITRLDKPYSWGYSERVYLIGKPELADPQKGNLVYDRDAWTGKGPFLLEGGGAYDYRKGEYFEPTLEEFVARTIKKKGQEDGSSFRGQSAVAIGTMDAVKAHREKLSDTDTSNAQKAETDEALEELIENVVKLSKKGLNEDAVAMVLARVCWRSSPMNHGAPSEMKTSRDTAKRILNELGVRVKDIKKPLVDSFMKAVAGLQNELEDYLESVPQRAVMFNEWEYAVMPESMKGTPGLDEMLERNGIKPVWHDGTEEGRRAALAGLVDNPVVSFSVIGRNARTWGKYTDRAFVGRDDGMWRAEIDARQAKLKRAPLHRTDDSLVREVEKRLAFFREKLNERERWEPVSKLWAAGEYDGRTYGEMDFLMRTLRGAGLEFENMQQMAGLGVCSIVLDANGTSAAKRLLRVVELPGVEGFNRLGEVLDFPELYEAYPELKKVPVRWMDDNFRYRGMFSSEGRFKKPFIAARRNRTDGGKLSTLLHEVQHWIQQHEGFAFGMLPDEGMDYKMSAGEIEARNVQARRYWNAEERSAIPFNETLEYPGEALVTFSMQSVTADWQNTLHGYLNNPPLPGTPAHTHDMVVCPTPAVMQMVGAKGLDMVVTPGVLDKVMRGKHAVSVVALEQLPAAMADPICIAVSDTPGCLEVVTELKEGQHNVLVAVQLNSHQTNNALVKVNRIASMYGKERIGNLMNHPMLYWNKAKARPWLASYRLQLPAIIQPKRASGRKILKHEDLVKYKMDTGLSFAMEKASLRALDLLTIRADERAGEQLIKDWQAACENWGRFSREDAGRLGNGAKMLGEMQALIGATKGVLPERYCRMGHLNGLMRWASIYAKMQQDGTLPQVGEIKGPIYQKFLEKLQQTDELNRLQGMSEQEAQEAMALLAGERLDTAMMKVARECRRRLELFLKDRELERIDHIVEKAYPKRQNGQKWPRGKMAADAYRRMERARQYMNLPADEVAERINDAKRKLDALDATDADFERKEEELEEEISLLQTFGCWENMGFEQARRACGVMTEMVLLGRVRWKEKLQAERRRANYDRARISRNFRTKLADVQRKRAKTDAKEKARKRTIGKNLARGFMSYSQLMLALEPKLGKEFTGRHMRMIAKAHERLQLGTQQLHRRMFSTLSEITGLKTEGEMEEWLKSNNEIIDTGIVLKPRFTETCRMTPEEVEEWLALSETQREARRKQADEEAAAKGEQPDNVPSEDVLERMREKLEASRKADTTPKEYVVTVEKRYESPLHCTKEAMLFAILTFEQEDYARLMDVNGVNEKALQRMRELVGDKLLRWGYAMREMLNEQGLTMAAVYEAHTGVPFAKRANYFRGVFDIAKAKDKGESIDSATSITGGKYGCLIPRQYHHQMLNWGTSATQVFIGTYKEQQNYICTSHITREWRTLLSNQGFEKRLRAEIGDAALDTIHGWCKLIDGSVIADAKVNAMMNRLLGKVMGAYAVSRLAGNVYTIIKQVSSVLNGFVGGYVPEQVLVGDAVAQQLTYRHIGFGEYAAALARAMSGQTEISAEEIANAGFIAGRKRVQGAHLEEAAMLAPGQSVPGKVGRAGRAVYEANMEAIGYMDRKCNTLAALAVADAVYRAAKRENKDGLVPDAELRRIAIETAGMAIDRAAQPHLRTQKGYWAAGGGAFGAMGNFFYMFKSEVLGKLGLYVGQMFAGHHGAWIGGALSFGVLNSLVLALIDYVRGYWYDDEEDKWEKRAKQFAWNVFANDISAVPVLGDLEGWGRSTMLGGRPWNSSLVDMVVPFKDMYTYGKREVKYIAEEESWDKHVQALCGFARALGAAGGWWQGNSRVAVGSCAELALAVAAISNIVRFGKDAVKKVVGED